MDTDVAVAFRDDPEQHWEKEPYLTRVDRAELETRLGCTSEELALLSGGSRT